MVRYLKEKSLLYCTGIYLISLIIFVEHNIKIYQLTQTLGFLTFSGQMISFSQLFIQKPVCCSSLKVATEKKFLDEVNGSRWTLSTLHRKPSHSGWLWSRRSNPIWTLRKNIYFLIVLSSVSWNKSKNAFQDSKKKIF